MEYKNICTKKTYKDRNGNEKTQWFVVGTLKTNDDSKQFIELGMFPGTAFYCFEPKPKEQKEPQADNSGDMEL